MKNGSDFDVMVDTISLESKRLLIGSKCLLCHVIYDSDVLIQCSMQHFTGVKIAWVELKSKKHVGLISSTYCNCNPLYFFLLRLKNAHVN